MENMIIIASRRPGKSMWEEYSYMPTIENLKKKHSKGNYNKEKAVKAWEYVAEYAAKLYHKEFGGGCRWYDVFNAETRHEVAKHLESVYFDEYIKE